MSSREKPILVKWLEETGTVIESVNPKKPRPFRISGIENPITISSLIKKATSKGSHLFAKEEFIQVAALVHNLEKCQKIIIDYAATSGLIMKEVSAAVVDPEDLPPHLQGLTLYLDPTISGGNRRSQCWYLVDSKNRLSEYAADHYMMALNVRNPMTLEGLQIAAKKYVPFYKPGLLRTIKDSHGNNVFNTYQPPKWKEVDNHGKPTKLPRLFRKLMTAMFPIKKEREFVLCWIAKSISGRAQTHLVLCGNPGVGKNRLKHVLRALHGFANTTDGKQSSLRKFNSQLKDCTLLWYDELKYGPEEIPTLKEIPNESMSIEQKGEDATKSSEIFASVVISNNKLRDNHLEFNDRKFSPVVLRKSRLEKSMTPEEIGELTEKTNVLGPGYDNEFVAQIARYLRRKYKNPEDRFPNLEYRGPMFWKIAHTSMTKAQKRAVDLVLLAAFEPNSSPLVPTKDGYLWSQVEAQLDKKLKDVRLADNTSFQNFFDTFRGPRGERIFKTRDLDSATNYTNDFYISFVDNIKNNLKEIFSAKPELEDNEEKEDDIYDIDKILGTDKEEGEEESRKEKRKKKIRRDRPSKADSAESDQRADNNRPRSSGKKRRALGKDKKRSRRTSSASLL